MSKVFGEYIEEFPHEGDSLELSFGSSPKLTTQSWRNNRLCADFAASYFSNLLSTETRADRPNDEQIKDIKNTVSFISNEFLENAVKFNDKTQDHRIEFGIYFTERIDVDTVIFTKNTISTQGSEKYQAFIHSLLTADPNDLYIQQIETAAADESSQVSGLGLLTMINDYSAKLGWKFESILNHPQTISVTTMAQVKSII
jgi:hypothetical protein